MSSECLNYNNSIIQVFKHEIIINQMELKISGNALEMEFSLGKHQNERERAFLRIHCLEKWERQRTRRQQIQQKRQLLKKTTNFILFGN